MAQAETAKRFARRIAEIFVNQVVGGGAILLRRHIFRKSVNRTLKARLAFVAIIVYAVS